MYQNAESMKKFHIIYMGIIFVLFIVLAILIAMVFGSGAGQNKKPGPIIVSLQKDAVHNVGVNFENGKPIVIDALTGEEIAPCGPSQRHDSDNNNQKSETTCKTELKLVNGVYQLIDVKTQKVIPSRIIEAVFVLWEGSTCNTTYAGGYQFETCQSKEAKCQVLPWLPGCN